MEIAISESLENFVKQAVHDGRFASESEVVNLGLLMVKEHDRKLAELRELINASIKAGGAHTSEEMESAMEAQCQELHAQGIPW
jgi:putative addiction module CopG family antidote